MQTIRDSAVSPLFSFLSLSLAHSHSHSLTHSLSLSLSFTLSRSLSLSLALSLSGSLAVRQDEDLVRMALAMRSLSEAQSLLDHGGMKLSGGEARRFDEVVHVHLRTWQRLALKFEANLIPLCNIRPKHHYLQHLARYVLQTRINIRVHQNFNAESYMGRIKRIACKCHSTAMLLRVQQRYILYLALIWDRAKRASVAGAVSCDSLDEILLRDWEHSERKEFSSTQLSAKRRCLKRSA